MTILPRGRALGYTMVLPTEDRYSKTRNQILDDLVYAMGGRVAEELVFRDPSTGASNDIQKASAQARALVTEYGMSDRIGNVRLSADESDPMTGYGMGRGNERAYSDELASIVDEEVRKFMDAEPAKLGRSSRRIVTSWTASLSVFLKKKPWTKPSWLRSLPMSSSKMSVPCGTTAKRLPLKVQSWATPIEMPGW